MITPRDSAEEHSDGLAEEPARGSGLARSRWASLPSWKKVLLTCAAFLVVAGSLLQAYQAVRGGEAGEERPGGQHTAQNAGHYDRGQNDVVPPFGGTLVDSPDVGAPPGTGGSPPGTEASTASEEWSPAMLRGGFGFFVGFSIGLVLRAFFKLSAVVIGLNLLVLFAMSNAGWVDVRWDLIEQQFDHWVGRLGGEVSEFKTFIAGSLPTAGLSGLGLFTGFRKR